MFLKPSYVCSSALQGLWSSSFSEHLLRYRFASMTDLKLKSYSYSIAIAYSLSDVKVPLRDDIFWTTVMKVLSSRPSLKFVHEDLCFTDSQIYTIYWLLHLRNLLFFSFMFFFFSCSSLLFCYRRNLADFFRNSWLPFFRTPSLNLQMESKFAFLLASSFSLLLGGGGINISLRYINVDNTQVGCLRELAECHVMCT